METPFAHMISREIRKSRAADMQLRLFQYLFCDGCDSVDSYIKCRCRTIFGFMEISVRNIFCSIFLICIQFFAVYSKCRSIKYMKGTDSLIASSTSFTCFFCAFCYNFFIERCDLICAVLRNLCTSQYRLLCRQACTVLRKYNIRPSP